MLEPIRGQNVLDIVLSLQNELVDNVKIYEPLGNIYTLTSKQNQKVKLKNSGETSTKVKIKI